MSDDLISLAIETSSRVGCVTLARDNEILVTEKLPPQRRHRVDLLPTIDRMFREQNLSPTDLKEAYVSLGPGSFTGLRIGIATVQMLAMAGNVQVVGVPTLPVVAQNVLADSIMKLAVALNLKDDTVYSATYTPAEHGWKQADEPALRTMKQIEALRADAVVGHPLPDGDTSMQILPESLAQPNSRAVWQLGRRAAHAEQWTDLNTLFPIYARQPEAVSLWEARKAKGS